MAGCAPLVPLGVLFGAGFIIALPVLDPLIAASHDAVILAVLALLAVLGIASYLRFRRLTYRRFFSKHVIQPAEEEGIGIDRLLGALDEARHLRHIGGAVNTMLANRDALIRLLQERGQYPADAQPQAAAVPWWQALMVPCLVAAAGMLLGFTILMARREDLAQQAQAQQRAAELTLLQERLPEYLRAGLRSELDKPPYVKGKVIVIDINTRNIDGTYFALPEDLRARSPEEVETIVLLEWGKLKVGEYEPTKTNVLAVDALVLTCKASLIDKQRGLIVGESQFRGGDPPPRLDVGKANYGPKPTPQIINWLKSLSSHR